MRKKLILICDSDRSTVRSLAAEFQLAGANVETAFDLESAVAQMDRQLPDLLCADLELSSPEGLSAFQMLATDPLAARIPGVGLTRRLDEAVEERTGGMCVYCVGRDAHPSRWVESVLQELLDLTRAAESSVSDDDDDLFASAP